MPRAASKSRLRAAPWVILIAGMVLGALAINGAWSNIVLLRDSQRAEGVVALSMGGGRSLVRFTAANGSMITYTQSKFIFARAKGDKVTVLYNSFVPADAPQADDPLTLWFNPVLFALLAAGLILVSVRFIRADGRV